MSHPSFLRTPSRSEPTQELEGVPNGEGEPSQEGGDRHPTGDSAPSGAGKAVQELLDTAARFDGMFSARAFSRDQAKLLLRATAQRPRPAARSPAVSSDFPTTPGADSPEPARLCQSANWFQSALAVGPKKRSPRPVLRSEPVQWAAPTSLPL